MSSLVKLETASARFPYLTSLELSQLQFHTSLLLSLKIPGLNQLKTFVVDYDRINYRYSELVTDTGNKHVREWYLFSSYRLINVITIGQICGM